MCPLRRWCGLCAPPSAHAGMLLSPPFTCHPGAGPGFERWVFKISNDVKNFDSPKLFQTGYRQYKLFFSPASNVPSDSSHVVPSYRFVKTSSINQQPRRQSSTSSVVTSVEQVTSWLCLPTHLGFSSHVYTNFGSLTLFISVV